MALTREIQQQMEELISKLKNCVNQENEEQYSKIIRKLQLQSNPLATINDFRGTILSNNFDGYSLHVVIMHKNKLFLISLKKETRIFNWKCGTVTKTNDISIYVNLIIDRWAKGINTEADFYITFSSWREEIYASYVEMDNPDAHLLYNTIENWVCHIEENFPSEQIITIFKN